MPKFTKVDDRTYHSSDWSVNFLIATDFSAKQWRPVIRGHAVTGDIIAPIRDLNDKPKCSRALVERATHADYLRRVADGAGDKWKALWRRLYERARIDRQLAEAGLVDWTRPYSQALVDDRYVTRLGEGLVTIATPGLVSPFTGNAIDALPLPGKWLSGAGPIDELTVAIIGNRISVAEFAFTYTTLGVQRDQA